MPSVSWVVAAAVAEALVGLLLRRDRPAFRYRDGGPVQSASTAD